MSDAGRVRLSLRRVPLFVVLALSAQVLVPVGPAGALSFRAKPRPETGAYLVTEVLVGSELGESVRDGFLISPHLGFMINHGERNAWGLAVSADLPHDWDEGDTRVGASVRYRRWLPWGRSIDVSLGRDWADESRSVFGIATFNVNEWLGAGVQVERRTVTSAPVFGALAETEETDVAVFPAVRISSLPGLSLTGVVLLGALATMVLGVYAAG